MSARAWLGALALVAGCGAPADWIEAPDGSRLRYVAPATFVMGSDDGHREDEGPAHEVTFREGYYLGLYEVTWGQYLRFCEATGHPPPDPGEAGAPPGDDHPVFGVHWHDAQAYCAWAGLRLPTEAEWEYAARGQTTRRFPWGEQSDPPLGNVFGPEDGAAKTAPVTAFPQDVSALGFRGMGGGVREMVQDWFGPYPQGPVTDPQGPASGERRVARGGGWSSPLKRARTTNRKRLDAQRRHPAFGFRVARDP